MNELEDLLRERMQSRTSVPAAPRDAAARISRAIRRRRVARRSAAAVAAAAALGVGLPAVVVWAGHAPVPKPGTPVTSEPRLDDAASTPSAAVPGLNPRRKSLGLGRPVTRAQGASWRLAPGQQVTPATTRLDLLVSEQSCASGQPATGRIEPFVNYDERAVTVTVLVRSYSQANCPANPPTPYTLLLDEPLGNRKLPQGVQMISWSNEVPNLAWDVQVGDYVPSKDISTRIRWTRYGRPIDDSIISSLAGAGHCGRQRAVELSLSPADGFPAPLSDPRTYIRDPDGAVSEDLRTLFDPDATLPPDALDTGYRAGPLQLWLAPSDLDEAAYVVIADDVERWPRSERSVGCY